MSNAAAMKYSHVILIAADNSQTMHNTSTWLDGRRKACPQATGAH
ncbi:MAG TPA: hypothetical protein VNW46_14365 [Gemmatimonadaceae bacterium]|nr:hypothetical protein [Gemmatimonadaceae bacterium]